MSSSGSTEFDTFCLELLLEIEPRTNHLETHYLSSAFLTFSLQELSPKSLTLAYDGRQEPTKIM